MSDKTVLTAPLPPLLVTPLQAAAMLHIGRTTLYHLTCDGVLTAIRIGRSTRYLVTDLERYVHTLVDSGGPTPQAR